MSLEKRERDLRKKEGGGKGDGRRMEARKRGKLARLNGKNSFLS